MVFCNTIRLYSHPSQPELVVAVKITVFLVTLQLMFCPVLSQAWLNRSETSKLGAYVLPGLNQEAYIKLGDINIGAVTSVYESPSSPDWNCTQFRYSISSVERSEAIAFAIEKLNNDPNILPNVTLGFVILDECSNTNMATGQALSFMPRIETTQCSSDTCESGSTNSEEEGVINYYDVIGVYGPGSSNRCVGFSLLCSLARKPVITSSATSDEFSDNEIHPYFIRAVPPDVYQVHAMLSFIHRNKWSYISVIYGSGSYGENAFDNIKAGTEDLGICIAYAQKITSSVNMTRVARDLLLLPRARVVIVFTYRSTVTDLFDSLKALNAKKHFIWIASDAWATSIHRFDEYVEQVAGTFTFSFFKAQVPEFEEHFRNLPMEGSANPWMKRTYEYRTSCSTINGNCDWNKSFTSMDDYTFSSSNANVIDSILTLGYAVHSLLASLCPGVTGIEARNCIRGQDYLRFIKNTTFDGYSGHIEFNEKGDLIGRYQIQQIVIDDTTHNKTNNSSDSSSIPTLKANLVALYDVKTSSIVELNDSKIMWNYFPESARLVPLRRGESSEIPESVCSRPCLLGEIMIQKELDCCWECRKCRDNEKLTNNFADCKACEALTWPDPTTNFTTCREIKAMYPLPQETLPLILIGLGVTSIVFTILVFVAYVYLREKRVIKAASRELSFMQLVAILVGYVTVLVFQVKPTCNVCRAQYYLFCLSFTWLYSPLLVKAVRIYRIFQSSTKYNRRPRFVSPKSQLIGAAVLISIQVILCIVVTILYNPCSVLIQPVRVVRHVDLACDMTSQGLISFLAYNLILVCLCSVLAFKTRHLPDNFNESRFMSMCVATTLVIWLAFGPTYLTTTRQHVRGFLLSAALLLNHTVALVFLYLPKIYAGIYMPDEPSMTMGAGISRRFQSDVASNSANTATLRSFHISSGNRINKVFPETSS